MYRVLPLMLLFGLIALAPMALPAQDKDDKKAEEKKVIDEPKKVEEKKVEEKVEEKKVETPVKAEEKKVTGTSIEVYRELDLSEKATQILPFVSIVLIIVLFGLVLSLRAAISRLEEKVKG